VYVPFGSWLNGFLQEVGFGWATVYDYEPGVPALDSAFVTPLVVTQLLNLLFKNLLPYWTLTKRWQREDKKEKAQRELEKVGALLPRGGGTGAFSRLVMTPSQPPKLWKYHRKVPAACCLPRAGGRPHRLLQRYGCVS
jgi:hypothetical protein